MALNLSEIAKENSIAFENLLAGIAREEVCALISFTEIGSRLWLRTPADLGIESYKNGVSRTLKYVYCPENRTGEYDISSLCDIVIESISGENGNNSIAGTHNGEGSIALEVRIDGMRVPMKLLIMESGGFKGKPIIKTERLIREDESFSYLQYPVESETALGIIKIFRQLELIEDISVYDSVFNEIMNTPLEGTLVWSAIREGINDGHLDFDPEIIETIKGYTNNKYLQNKWNEYQKRRKNMSCDWKKIIIAITIFVTPIWEAICEDRPFVGDWMPELGRFL